ncbi:MAG TPA: malto-oligosyltrehalose trehalohydrolase [Flavisolibacter sp.]|nr:malto-oligosyltrehalose trehalohydrolase [Flavisolibacter sp.]
MKPIDISKRGVGVYFTGDGKAGITLWSPDATSIELCCNGERQLLEKAGMGYWTGSSDKLKAGDRYTFRIDGDKELPDPASLSQPDGVHGPSQAVDAGIYRWTDEGWNNPALQDYILYELHTGCFSDSGDFGGIEARLPYLKSLGINAIEIMPVAQFPGSRNWGYDGVYPFAVQDSYGGAKGLQQLVDACHRQGIAVVLDVVYNHLGPEGNYLGAYGPYTTDKYKTPWGGAINFDDAWCDGVRRYFIENALMWFRDFHIDALRLDAVHAIKDFSPRHILEEIRLHTDALMALTGRRYYLIAELDLNDDRYINPVEKGGYGMDGQWVDEFHHALRTAAGGERTGYYSDFNGIGHLAKAYADAYVYDGQFSEHRKKNFGVKTSNPGHQFVVFSQNHDQVGNRMLGERTSTLASFEMQKLLAAAVFMSPYLPMLFMGEEWGEPNPFLYFVSHTDPDLAKAVREGRKAEFAAFHARGEAPDPMEEDTFLRSKLQWELTEQAPHRYMLEYYKQLITLRKTQPVLRSPDRKALHAEAREDKGSLILHRWTEGQDLICWMNFSNKEQCFMPPSSIQNWQLLLDSASPDWRGPAAAPERISGAKPGAAAIILQPESVLVYTDRIHAP